jgi:hypothetical protein
MDVVAGVLQVSAIVFPGSILTFVLVRLLSIRLQKKARLKMKRHLQKMDVPDSISRSRRPLDTIRFCLFPIYL